MNADVDNTSLLYLWPSVLTKQMSEEVTTKNNKVTTNLLNVDKIITNDGTGNETAMKRLTLHVTQKKKQR